MTHASADLHTAEDTQAGLPSWLRWSIGAAAFLLCLAAFLLWGINGPAYLLELTAVYCG